MDLVHQGIDAYLAGLAAHRDPVLAEMEALGRGARLPDRRPAGRVVCSRSRARVRRAQRVLELGSGFGYSAYWFLRAVGRDGTVLLTEGLRATRQARPTRS